VVRVFLPQVAETRYPCPAMPGWIGPWEIAILLVIVLLVFGPKRLPEMGRSLGKGMREFKDSITGKDDATPAELPAQTPDETISASTKSDS
jgi:sec-independent protein translocase protein TatA